MNRSRTSFTLGHLLTVTASLLVSGQYPLKLGYAQTAQDGSGASTIASKQKVSVIIDRERTPERTVLLLKILVPQDAKVESFALENPARIVVDFHGVSIKTTENLVPPKNSVIKMIRLGAHADKLRIVMDLSTPTTPQYEWRGGTRQATLRILESGTPSAPTAATAAPAAPAAPATPQAEPPKAPAAPTAIKTPAAPPTAPAAQPTKPPPPTVTPTSTPTVTPTLTPTKAVTIPSAPAPTSAPTNAPATQPAVEQRNTTTAPKLPDMTDKELEEELDREVAKAAQALERGEELPDTTELEGEDLVDVPVDDREEPDLSEEKKPAVQPAAPTTKTAGIVTKDLPTGTTNQPAAKPDSLNGLRANPIPVAPVTDFTIQRAEFSFLEPDHKEAFRVALSQGSAQARMSKVDPTTYKIVIPKCGLANLGLALPQYPPAEFKGLLAATPKVEGDTVEITIQVEEGVSLTTLMRDKELWIKRQ
jgi:hypothetical protein